MAIICVKQIDRNVFEKMAPDQDYLIRKNLDSHLDYFSEEIYINPDHIVKFNVVNFIFYTQVLYETKNVQRQEIETIQGKNSSGDIFEYELSDKLLDWFNANLKR